MTVKTWKVLDIGKVDIRTANRIEFDCECGAVAELPVNGRAIAATTGGVIFDPGNHAVPRRIQCRQCGRVLDREAA
jgi:hypothetical protein